MNIIFRNIEAERVRLPISKKELAATLGITTSTLRNWYTERTEIPASKLISMSQLFGCSIDYLLGIHPNQNQK